MAKFKVKPGDVFPVPAVKNGEYGFLLARTISTGTFEIIEVFEKFHTDFLISSEDALAQAKDIEARLFAPIYAVFLFDKMTGSTKWPVLASNPKYNETFSDSENITFLAPDFHELGFYVKGGKEFKDPMRTMVAEDATIWQQHQIVFRVEYYMNGFFTKGQIFDYGEIAGDLYKNGLLDQVMSKAIATSETVAQMFKLLRKK